MRLKQSEINIIKNIVQQVDKSAKVYLYGSRVNDKLKGGDIDLMVFSEKISFMEQLKIKAEMHHQLGEQKIDLLITEDLGKPFVQLVLETAVLL